MTLEPGADRHPKQFTLPSEPGQEPREFVVTATHSQSGKALSPFLVRAKDEAAARKLCQRNYLVLQSVAEHVEQEGREKPRIFAFGPPISDRDFERDYGSRPSDTPGQGPAPYVLGALGWFFCGPIGFLLGWWAGSESEGSKKSD